MKWKKDINTVTSFNSIVAGILIGLGVIINTQTNPPILGAFLFSFGLLTIIHLKLPLFTGKVGFLKDDLILILIGNLLGVSLTTTIYTFVNPSFYLTLEELATIKFSKTYLQLLLAGFFCGMLIHFAVKCKIPYITSMAVMIFILINAEHCIADFPFLLTDYTIENICKFLLIIIGNSIGAIFIENIIYYE